MSSHTFETKAKCSTCKGTGLYVGFAEKDGAAVVCSKCKGTGCVTLKLAWEDFGGRKKRKGIRRVFRTNPGYVIGDSELANIHIEDFGGMPAADWYAGKPFPKGSEARNHTCPAHWYQNTEYDRKPRWDECGFGMFSACKHFVNKYRCWARFDREGL